MFNINIRFDEVSIISVEKEDIFEIQNWINKQQGFNIKDGLNYGIVDFYERYIEYYVSEGEYFKKYYVEVDLLAL